jgi:trans-2-enoyl-CoA reductase
VIGSSTGYGLASRITAAFGSGAATLGIFYERPSEEGRPATPGWYNTHRLHQRRPRRRTLREESQRRRVFRRRSSSRRST